MEHACVQRRRRQGVIHEKPVANQPNRRRRRRSLLLLLPIYYCVVLACNTRIVCRGGHVGRGATGCRWPVPMTLPQQTKKKCFKNIYTSRRCFAPETSVQKSVVWSVARDRGSCAHSTRLLGGRSVPSPLAVRTSLQRLEFSTPSRVSFSPRTRSVPGFESVDKRFSIERFPVSAKNPFKRVSTWSRPTQFDRRQFRLKKHVVWGRRGPWVYVANGLFPRLELHGYVRARA